MRLDHVLRQLNNTLHIEQLTGCRTGHHHPARNLTDAILGNHHASKLPQAPLLHNLYLIIPTKWLHALQHRAYKLEYRHVPQKAAPTQQIGGQTTGQMTGKVFRTILLRPAIIFARPRQPS